MSLLDVCDALLDHLPAGAVARLRRVCKTTALCVHHSRVLLQRTKLKRATLSNLNTLARRGTRCRECLVVKRASKRLSSQGPRSVCLRCAGDANSFRYAPRRQMAIETLQRWTFERHASFASKGALVQVVQSLRPIGLTQTHAHLFDLRDLREAFEEHERRRGNAEHRRRVRMAMSLQATSLQC